MLENYIFRVLFVLANFSQKNVYKKTLIIPYYQVLDSQVVQKYSSIIYSSFD